MKWTYDSLDRALYIYLDRAGDIAEQVEMPDGTIVDVDEGGGPVGIEVVRAWADWDIDGVVTRFGLTQEEASFLRLVANQPAIRSRPGENIAAMPTGFGAAVRQTVGFHLEPA